MNTDDYYRSLPSKATHRELWRMAKSPFQGLVGSLMKSCGSTCRPGTVSLAPPAEIPLAELPSHVQALMDEPLGQLRALGFEPALAVRGRTIGAMEGYSVFCLNQDHDTWSATVYARTHVAHVRAHEVATGMSSQLRDDLWVMTSRLYGYYTPVTLADPRGHFHGNIWPG